ncbi:MAG TPA: hypothetical protein VKX16_10300 [Chloroflexota bacterium]|nr:hypothetical protein [Chloroflexota bacterium]
MFMIPATIRDYNGATDTASLELIGIGILDSWLDNVKIDASLNRALITHGALVTVSTPDPHRVCEATVTAVAASPAVTTNYSGSTQILLTGRGYVLTNNVGVGSSTFNFGHTFASTTNLLVTVQADFGYASSIAGVSTTGCTVTLSGCPPNQYVYFSWSVQGDQ